MSLIKWEKDFDYIAFWLKLPIVSLSYHSLILVLDFGVLREFLCASLGIQLEYFSAQSTNINKWATFVQVNHLGKFLRMISHWLESNSVLKSLDPTKPSYVVGTPGILQPL